MFDPTLYPVIKAYSFKLADSPELDSSRIKMALRSTGMPLVELKEGILTKRKPSVELNFNGIAQGFTVDKLAQLLENCGVSDFMIEVGGELCVKGRRSETDPWKIGIDKPLIHGSRQIICKVGLENRSMATSGNYRKFMMINGKPVGHIINPKTGFPTPTNLLSVTVFSDNCAKADGYATAFMCMDRDEVRDIVSRDPDLDVILVMLDERDTSIYVSPGISTSIID
jgi:thiamine biosynthesis lipoprotein